VRDDGASVSSRPPSPAAASRPGSRPFLDFPQRWRAAQVLLGLAGVLAVTALARPLAADRPTWLRAGVLLLLAAGAAASALLTSLRGRGTHELLALYAFLVLSIDALGQWTAPWGWPVWPAIVLLVAAVAVAEPLPLALGVAALAAVLEAAQAARGDSAAAWKPALAAVVGYGGLALAVHRALTGEKSRLSTTLAELARLRHGIAHLDDTVSSLSLREGIAIREVSEEERRARQMERAAELDTSLERIVRLAHQSLAAHAVALFSIDREREKACLRAAEGPSTLKRDAIVPVRDDPFAFVVSRGQTFYATDFKRLLWDLPYYVSEVKVGSIVAAPVFQGRTVTGVLVADRLEVQSFTTGQPEMLESFAEMAAEEFAHAREMASREELGTDLEVVYGVSQEIAPMEEVGDLCARLMTFAEQRVLLEGGAVVVLDEARTRYVVHAAAGWAEPFVGREVALDEETWLAWMLNGTDAPDALRLGEIGRQSHRRPVLVLDEDNRSDDSLLVLPLRLRQHVLGALVLTAAKGELRPAATRVVEILVNQAAALLANIQLANREKDRAMKDPLTALYNRRAFFENLAQAIARRERQADHLCLLMLDLDHFKKLNDTHGHPAGDAALKKTAEVLRRELRKGDVPARYGGEEFVIMLPGATETVARRVAERLRAALEEVEIAFGGTTLHVTASLGLAVWPDNGREAEELLSSADRALYAAKAGGRNRVVCAPPTPQPATPAEA
jgi:diguanylate cyclase (GGDEF)-like protein